MQSDEKKAVINTINLSGPVSFYHIKYNDKEILLFGDEHSEYDNNAPFNFLNFIKLLSDKSNQNKNCIDFFIEDVYDVKSQTVIPNASKSGIKFFVDSYASSRKELIFKLRTIFSTEGISLYTDSNDYKYFRIHGWDWGRSGLKPSLIYYTIDNLDILDIKNKQTLYNFYCNNPFLSLNKKDFLASKDPYIILFKDTLYKADKRFNYELEQAIAIRIHKQLANIDNKYFTAEILIKYFLTLYETSKRNLNLRGFILETYAIARMFRLFKNKHEIDKCDAAAPNKIVYFGGSNHTVEIVNFLKYLQSKDINFEYEYPIQNDAEYKKPSSHFIVFPIKNYFGVFDKMSDDEITSMIDTERIKYLKYKEKYLRLKATI